MVTGWGKLSESGTSAEVLQKVVVPIISDQQCEAKYRAIGYDGPIAETMLCAGYGTGAKDACQVHHLNTTVFSSSISSLSQSD